MPGHRMRRAMHPAAAFLFISLAFILLTLYSFVGQTSRFSVRRLRPAERLKSKQELKEEVAAEINIFNGIDLEFLPNFKNPCWYERQGFQNEGNKHNIYSAWLKPASASVLANYRNQERAGYVLRCLPYFFLIGQPKCATTDVFQRINIHPDVAESLLKGPHWWTRRRYGQPYSPRPVTFMEYLDLFNGAAIEIEGNWTNTTTSSLPYHEKITGDGSTSTLWDSGPIMNYLYSTFNKSSVDKLIQMFFSRREGLDYHPKELELESLNEQKDGGRNTSVFKDCCFSSQNSVEDYKNYERTLYKQDYSIQPGVVLPITAADVVHSVLPQSRIIAVIREPVSRLFSSYVFFTKNREKNPHTFEQDVKSSIQKWNSCVAVHSERTCAYNKTLHNNLEVRLYNGMYSIFLRDWLNVFPRDQVMVIRMEDYHQDIAATMASIYAHLGLRGLTSKEETQVKMAPVQNTNRKKTDIGKMLNSTTHILKKFYQEYNKDLAELLGDLRFNWLDFYH